jgi:DNA-binding response OmpR family regulator
VRRRTGRAKVAVVDDDREVREYLAESLAMAGFDVAVAANGLRLVSAMQADPPDVIVLDVMMSWIDGVDLCRALKANPEFGGIPVVIISGKADPRTVARSMAAGAVDYFPKPLDVGRLIERLRTLVGSDPA